MGCRVLIVSHNVLSKTSNMGRTLANFFEGWDSNCIAQLYFHSEVPTTRICKNYYRITDFDVIKNKKQDTGTILSEQDINETLKTQRVYKGINAQIYQLGIQRKSYMYIGRNLIWTTKKWKNKKLLEWVDEFNPDVLFFASGDYVFSYKIAMEIAEYKKIPIVTYICDDFYFVKRKSFSPLYYINRWQYSRILQKLFSKHKNVVAICDKITKDYGKEFKVNAKTFMTLSEVKPFIERELNQNCVISYIGNLGYNRHLSIIEIGKILKKITNNAVLLDVYSAEKRSEIVDMLTEENGIRFHGSIGYSKVIDVMKNSDILVHTESMDEINRNKVRYSVSTKIADSLSCGRCLFAYGPSEVASIEYLKENNCACVVTKADDLKEMLKQIICDYDLRCKYTNKALKTAQENHNLERNSVRFYEFMQKVAKENVDK